MDLSTASAQAAQVAVEAQVVDVNELAQHVEVLDHLRRLDRLEAPHVLRPHSRLLVATHVTSSTVAWSVGLCVSTHP